jgi:hypothetical protein
MTDTDINPEGFKIDGQAANGVQFQITKVGAGRNLHYDACFFIRGVKIDSRHNVGHRKEEALQAAGEQAGALTPEQMQTLLKENIEVINDEIAELRHRIQLAQARQNRLLGALHQVPVEG